MQSTAFESNWKFTRSCALSQMMVNSRWLKGESSRISTEWFFPWYTLWSSASSSLGTFRAGGCTHLKNLICTGGLILCKLVSSHFQPVYIFDFPMEFCTQYMGVKESDTRWNGWVKKIVHLCFISFLLSTFWGWEAWWLLLLLCLDLLACDENVYVCQHRAFLLPSAGLKQGTSENEDGVIDTAGLSVM